MNLSESLPWSLNTSNSTSFPNTGDGVFDILSLVSKFVCIAILLVGVFGNSLVLFVFGSRWSKLKACEIFMISLAVSDLIGTIVTSSLKLLEIMGADFAPIHDVGCKLIHFSIITSVTVSSLTLIAITFDRFVIVKWPLRQRLTFKALRHIVLLTWVLGSGPGIVYLVGDYVRLYKWEGSDVHICQQFLKDSAKVAHTFATFSVQVVIPLLLMVIIYSLIIFELWKTTKTRQFLMREREMTARYKRNRKAIELLIIIVVVFFVCITPVNVFFLFYMFDALDLPMNAIVVIFTILLMLQMCNSCVNPIIYSRKHSSFRRTTLRLLCWCCVEKVRDYDWEDLGGNFKSVVTQSFRFASARLSRVSLGVIKPPSIPNRSLKGCSNGNIHCRKAAPHRHCRKPIGSHKTNLEVKYNVSPETVGSPNLQYDNKNFPPIPSPPFALGRSKQYISGDHRSNMGNHHSNTLSPLICNDAILKKEKLEKGERSSIFTTTLEVNGHYRNGGSDGAFVSTTIFPNASCVNFETQPLVDRRDAVAV